jgi:hypothetical protein
MQIATCCFQNGQLYFRAFSNPTQSFTHSVLRDASLNLPSKLVSSVTTLCLHAAHDPPHNPSLLSSLLLASVP